MLIFYMYKCFTEKKWKPKEAIGLRDLHTILTKADNLQRND